MEKSETIRASKSSKSKDLSMTDSLKAFANEDNIIKATEFFFSNGLGIDLWNRGNTELEEKEQAKEKEDYFKDRLQVVPQYLLNILGKIETIITTEFISKKILKIKQN